MKKNVLILFGGVSTEHEISCLSAGFVFDNTDSEKYNIYRIGITKNGAWWLYSGTSAKMRDGSWNEDTENLRPAILSPCSAHQGILVFNKEKKTYEAIHIDTVFPVLHGKNGEDGTMQGLLQIAGLPYVGPSAYSSAVCMDKATAKLLCERKRIKTAPFLLVRKTPDFDINRTVCETEEAFDYPVFVKPSNSGSSVGITKSKNRAELMKGITEAFENDRKILIEKNISGKEIETAVFASHGNITVSVPGEIEPCADFYDYDTKYKNDTAKTFIPARISEKATEKVREWAKIIFKELDCDGLSRVDFFVDGDDVVFNEINTIPGFTSISMYPQLMNAIGLGGKSLVTALIESAERH